MMSKHENIRNFMYMRFAIMQINSVITHINSKKIKIITANIYQILIMSTVSKEARSKTLSYTADMIAYHKY